MGFLSGFWKLGLVEKYGLTINVLLCTCTYGNGNVVTYFSKPKIASFFHSSTNFIRYYVGSKPQSKIENWVKNQLTEWILNFPEIQKNKSVVLYPVFLHT